jgi:ribosomal protein S6--L-glutamate ligase
MRPAQMSQARTIVGSTEWCGFPTLGMPHILARVDSGAKTSALHAFNIQRFSRNEQAWVSFEVHPVRKNRRIVVRCEAPISDRRVIKSSTGETEKRYVIRVPMRMGEHVWDVELTLSNRDSMGHRMLLGREAMSGRLLVDPDSNCRLGTITEEQIETAYEVPSERRATGLRIAVLASNPDLYSNERLLEAGHERGHEMLFLNVKHCYMKLDASAPQVHHRGGMVVGQLDAVIPRIRPSVTFYGCALTRHFEAMGVYCLNSASAISQSRDKLFALQLLLSKGIDIPTSGFAHSPVETTDLIEMVGGAPLVVKLLEGTQGRGVVLAETRKAAESVINAFKSLNANLLVQEFIKEAGGKDIRCFVVDGKVVASMQRQAAEGEFRANLHQGGTASVVRITPSERAMALRATKTLGLKVAGVDIIRSRNGPLLLEVNSSPGLEGIELATGKDVAGSMISSIEKALEWQRPLAATTPGGERFELEPNTVYDF